MAHPDDETIACGGLLQRMQEPLVVFATDGAPLDEHFWKSYGSPDVYAHVRKQEAQRALDHVERSRIRFLGEHAGIRDQELLWNLSNAYEFLMDLVRIRRPDAILTLAYEGGHPDHDCCNFLAHEVGRRTGLEVWEAPLYRRNKGADLVLQRFIHKTDDMLQIHLSPEELERKVAMAQAYASQGDFLKLFDISREVIRPLARYDYARPPHDGQLNYEAWGWRITGKQVCAAFSAFRRELLFSEATAG